MESAFKIFVISIISIISFCLALHLSPIGEHEEFIIEKDGIEIRVINKGNVPGFECRKTVVENMDMHRILTEGGDVFTIWNLR